MNKRMRYCDFCRRENEVELKSREATYNFRKESFDIIEQYAECMVCKNPVTDEELGNSSLKLIKDLYETKYGFSPEMLKDIRRSFNLSQALFAKLLNMGIATVKRYELGKTAPDLTQLGIYKMLKENPTSIKQFYDIAKESLTIDESNNLKEKLEPYLLEDDDIKDISYKVLSKIFEEHQNSIDNGFSTFNAIKLFNMILYFSRKGVLKTKLMKLLWYSDFLRFKRDQTVISGTPYIHMKFGPVPKSHDLILGCLDSMEWINIVEEEYMEGYFKINIVAKRDIQFDIFTKEDIKVMEDVEIFFKDFGSRDITEFSHDEIGWIQTKESDIIPFSYAQQLQLQ